MDTQGKPRSRARLRIEPRCPLHVGPRRHRRSHGRERAAAEARRGQSSGPPRRRVALLLPALPSSRQGFRRRTIRPSPRFDAVYTCGVLQHLSDHELYEGACFMERAVTDKGTLIVVVPLTTRGIQIARPSCAIRSTMPRSSSAWAFGWPRRKSGTASALPVTSADERPAFFFATRKAS